MKQYVIDQLRHGDHAKIKAYLDEHLTVSGVDGVYWLPLHEDLLSSVQRQHGECRPHYLALELEPERLSCELLVRAENRIRCDCIRYATDKQRNWLICTVDAILEKLEIQI